jgi:polysaccharide biosynthesis/export protein
LIITIIDFTVKIFYTFVSVNNQRQVELTFYTMKRHIRLYIIGLTLTSLVLINNSCMPYKKLKYFNDLDEISEPITNPLERKPILPFDNLYIRILSIDEQNNQLFDPNQGTGTNQLLINYLVDENGNIDFPFIGLINLKGLTLAEAQTKMQSALSEYVPKCSVIVRYVENSISVIGYVTQQGTFQFSTDKLNIYEALSLAGGITQFGDHEKVILIRQVGNKTIHQKLDLSDSKIAGKEYYYVQSNDIIVVEPIRAAAWDFNFRQFATLLSTITSILALYVIFSPQR